VSITPNERNWRGICIALLVIVAVLALILFFIVLLSPPYEGPFNPGIKFTIDNVIGTDFQSCPFNGSWISSEQINFYIQGSLLHLAVFPRFWNRKIYKFEDPRARKIRILRTRKFEFLLSQLKTSSVLLTLMKILYGEILPSKFSNSHFKTR